MAVVSSRTARSRHITPPAGPGFLEPHSVGSTRSSKSYKSSNSSPSTTNTGITTPPRSPARSPVKFSEREILPRVRPQDQVIETETVPVIYSKSMSVTSTGFPVGYNPHMAPQTSYRRSVSPGDCSVITPVSMTSFMDSYCDMLPGTRQTPPPNTLEVPTAYSSHSRSSSVSNHSRSSSSCQMTEHLINRYAYPTYRQAPVCTTTSKSMQNKTAAASLPTPVSASSTSANYSCQPSYQSTCQQPSLASELLFDNYAELPPSTTLLDYLTAPNPSPSLVRRVPSSNRLADSHFWWDIRNIRPWSDFSLETIHSIPGLTDLLSLSIPEPALPNPSRPDLQPESLRNLRDVHESHFALKVNAAIKVATGTPHLNMIASKQSSQPGATQRPEFVANYASSPEMTLNGDQQRGRVIGLVRSYEQWNSGMRSEPAMKKIAYMRELAHLQKFMREHSCRYGFIMTEIELVCVRMGSLNSAPVFGLLELATPIQLNTSGKNKFTAGLALWYLHMLAKNTPLPGQCGWKVDVGGAAALTRRNFAERDSWITFIPEGREKRDAKRARGWVFPNEPLSRKECGRPKRFSKKAERERLEAEEYARV